MKANIYRYSSQTLHLKLLGTLYKSTYGNILMRIMRPHMCTNSFTTRSSRSFDKFIVQTDFSLPLVTRELLQNAVDVEKQILYSTNSFDSGLNV